MSAASVVDLPEPVGPVTRTRPERRWPNSLTTVRDAELLEGGDLGRDEPENGAVTVGLLEEIAAEPRVLIHLVGEVEIARGLVALPALRAGNLAQHVAHFLVGQEFLADGYDVAMAANLGRLALAEVKVGGAGVDENFEELIDVVHADGEGVICGSSARMMAFCSQRS